MARLINLNNETDVLENISTSIKNRLGNIYTGQDSVVNILSESFSEEIINLRREQENVFNENQLSNSSGETLDRIAYEMYKVTRKEESTSRALDRERCVYFYVDTGIFGTINNGQDILIPEGTLISTDADFLNSSILYRTMFDYTLGAEESVVYCSVEALNPGSYANVNGNTLIFHNFINYDGAFEGGLKVSNKYPIINGSDVETDESFKFRVTNHFESLINSNQEAIRLAALSTPGVGRVKVIPSYFGIGTTGVVVFGAGRETNRSLTEMVESKILEMNLASRNIRVVEGIKVYLDFTIRVYVEKGLSLIEKEEIKSLIKNDIYSYIKAREYRGSINFREISRDIISNFNSTRVLGFGTKEKSQNVFENIYIRKTDRFDLFPEEKQVFLGFDYSVGDDERVGLGEVIIEIEEEIR